MKKTSIVISRDTDALVCKAAGYIQQRTGVFTSKETAIRVMAQEYLHQHKLYEDFKNVIETSKESCDGCSSLETCEMRGALLTPTEKCNRFTLEGDE